MENKRASDIERLCQCIICWRDPSTCGSTEADEDEKGYCNKFFGGRPYVANLEGGDSECQNEK